jgi:hypothetical protein
MKFLLPALLLFSCQVFAQVGDFLPTEKTVSKPFGLPIKIDLDGKINFVTGDRDLVFAPGIQIGFSKNTVQYSLPKMTTEFSLRSPDADSGWMEFKRLRYEYGAGLLALAKQTFRLGLAPYKGAKLSMRRLKNDKNAITPDNLRLPKTLAEIENWNVSDEGTYQTYGGIQVYGGADLGPVNAVMITLGWQNQFSVVIQRTTEGASVTITEEGLNRQSVYVGVDPLNATATHFKGKQLRAEFQFDFSNPLHHELYASALKGELTKLEEKLTESKRKISWFGHDLTYYWGIPWLIANTSSRGSYHVTDDKQEYDLEVLETKRSGLLISASLQQRFVYHNSDSILLMWTTDMSKSNPERLRRHFFGPAKAVGFTGFDLVLDDKRNYGTIIGEVGVVITKEDVDHFSTLDHDVVRTGLKARCLELKDKCAREKHLSGIMKRYTKAMSKAWELRKKSLGIIMVKEPALLYTLLKGSRTVKEAYFKFFSDRYQSLEGLTELDL